MKKTKTKIIALVSIIIIILFSLYLFFSNSKNSAEDVKLSYVGENFELNFNPQKQPGYNNFLVNLNANLAIFTKNGETKPYAASKIEMTKDNLSVDISLKPGLKFENGESISAQNYLDGLKVLVNPKTKAIYSSWALDNIIGASEYASNKSKTISGFEIKDNLHFKIKLIKPLHYFKDMLVAINFAPVSQKFIDKVGIENYGVGTKNFLSSGPLKVKEYKKSQSISYELNSVSSLAKDVKVKSVLIKFINSEVAQAQLFKANKIDSIVRSENIDKIIGKDLSKYNVQTQSTPYMVYLAINSQNVDKNVAKALDLVIDKNYINKVFLNNAHKIRSVVTPDNYTGLDEKLQKLGIDVNESKTNMLKAKSLAFDRTKTYKLWDDSSINSSVLKYIKNQAKQVGININIEKVPAILVEKEAYKTYGARKYDFIISSNGQDFSNPATFLDTLFNSKSQINFPNYANADFDKLLNNAKNAKTTDEEMTNYALATKKLYDDKAIIVLYQRVKQYLIHKGSYQSDVIGRMGIVNNWQKVN